MDKPATPQPNSLENFYAAPQSPAEFLHHQAGNMWRLGDLLIATKNTELPPICIKTGAPATVYKTRKLSWHSPWAYLGLLLGLIPFVIIASIITKRGSLRVGLSARAAATRSKWIAAGWIGTVAIIAGMVVGSNAADDRDHIPMVVGLGIVLLLTWVIIASRKAALMTPKRISATHIFVKGVHPAVLEGFPTWTYPLK